MAAVRPCGSRAGAPDITPIRPSRATEREHGGKRMALFCLMRRYVNSRSDLPHSGGPGSGRPDAGLAWFFLRYRVQQRRCGLAMGFVQARPGQHT